jgi:hypothetical protein
MPHDREPGGDNLLRGEAYVETVRRPETHAWEPDMKSGRITFGFSRALEYVSAFVTKRESGRPAAGYHELVTGPGPAMTDDVRRRVEALEQRGRRPLPARPLNARK